MNCRTVATIVALAACAAACTTLQQVPARGAVPVKVVHVDGRYELLRGGVPYHIRGAGLGSGPMQALAANGANSFRTWSVDNRRQTGQQVLDAAARNGLTVAMGIVIGKERHGFDYDDPKAVARQFEEARRQVIKYKDHPALLLWIIGNEVNAGYTNPKVFDAINDISRMIHEVDGKHPTTTALSAFDPGLAGVVASHASDLDFISIQKYGGIFNVPKELREAGYRGPYMITEWGPLGFWETRKTAWGAPLEQDSSDKADFYLRAYQTVIAPGPDQLIGSYVFLWGHKQERTPTWFGMFLTDGSSTEVVDVMHYLWTGAWPANRSPRVGTMTFDGKRAEKGVTLAPDTDYVAQLPATDPDGDPLHYRWQVMQESAATQSGGDPETVPPVVPVRIDDAGTGRATVRTPREPGAYRLFGYVYDGKGHAGYANIPFLVR